MSTRRGFLKRCTAAVATLLGFAGAKSVAAPARAVPLLQDEPLRRTIPPGIYRMERLVEINKHGYTKITWYIDGLWRDIMDYGPPLEAGFVRSNFLILNLQRLSDKIMDSLVGLRITDQMVRLSPRE